MAGQKRKLVVIDDDRLLCDSVQYALEDMEIMVLKAHTGAEGLRLCADTPVDVVLLDQQLPDANGIDFCGPILDCHEGTKIIFITAYPSFENAVQAIKIGAYDYLSKPFEMEELRLAVNKALRTTDLERLEQVQRYEQKRQSDRTVLIGTNGGLQALQHMVDLTSANQAPVLITGETGTGKTLVAKAIHYRGQGTRGAFIAVNCAAIPESLMEAELFGHEKGAYTGAVTAAKGLFEMAEKGSLFLDEISEIPLHLQSKLLGVLDDHKIRRLGGQSLKPVNVRIIAATNVDMAMAVKERLFREDLFYRLSVVHIHVPPLRERTGDLPNLCRYFISQIAADQNILIDEEQIAAMQSYHWPGNVRELRNIIERAILLRTGPRIETKKLLGQSVFSSIQSPNQSPSGQVASLQSMEKNHIQMALRHMNGNHTQSAKALGISRSTLMRKIKTYGLEQ